MPVPLPSAGRPTAANAAMPRLLTLGLVVAIASASSYHPEALVDRAVVAETPEEILQKSSPSLLQQRAGDAARLPVPIKWVKPLGPALKLLGQGGFGRVLQHKMRCPPCANCTKDPGVGKELLVALKEQEYKSEQGRLRALHEIQLMRKVFTGPSFPNLIAAGEDPDESEIFILMESAKSDLTSEYSSPLRRKFRLFTEALYGVAEMHRLGFIHRDLKPQNIFVSQPTPSMGGDIGDSCVSLIGDFGITIPVSIATKQKGRAGTRQFMAPEVLLEKRYTQKLDSWAMGLTLYNLLFIMAPPKLRLDESPLMQMFADFNMEEDREVVKLETWVERQMCLEGVAADLKAELAKRIRELLVGLMTVKDDARLSVDEALEKASAISVLLGNDPDFKASLTPRAEVLDKMCPFVFDELSDSLGSAPSGKPSNKELQQTQPAYASVNSPEMEAQAKKILPFFFEDTELF